MATSSTSVMPLSMSKGAPPRELWEHDDGPRAYRPHDIFGSGSHLDKAPAYGSAEAPRAGDFSMVLTHAIAVLSRLRGAFFSDRWNNPAASTRAAATSSRPEFVVPHLTSRTDPCSSFFTRQACQRSLDQGPTTSSFRA